MSRSFCDLHPKEEFCPTEIFNFNSGGLIHVDSLSASATSLPSCKKNHHHHHLQQQQQAHCCNHHLPQLFGQSINIEVDSCVPVPVQLPASIKQNIKQNLKNFNSKNCAQAFSSSCCHFHHHHPPPPNSTNNNNCKQSTAAAVAALAQHSHHHLHGGHGLGHHQNNLNSNGYRNDIVFTRLELKLKEKTRKKLQEKMENNTTSTTNNNSENLATESIQNVSTPTPNSKSSKRNKSRANSNDSNIGNSDSNSSSCNSVSHNNNIPNTNNIHSNHHHHHNHGNIDDICTLLVDCQCKLCLQKQKLREELIAEEESSKKKKQKRKKKKSGKSKKELTVVIKEEDEDEEEDEESVVNLQTVDTTSSNIQNNNNSNKKSNEDNETITLIDNNGSNSNNKSNSHNNNNKSKSGGNNNNSNCNQQQQQSTTAIIDTNEWPKSDESKPNSPRLVSNQSSANLNRNSSQDQSGLDQWIKVKSNKSKHGGGGGSGEHETTTGKRRGNLSEAFEAEASGSPGGSSGRRRNSTDEPSSSSLSSLMDSINLSEFSPLTYNKSAGSGGLLAAQLIAASHKAKLLAMDANLAFLRGDLKDALDLIDEAIELDPKCCPFYINRSYYYARMGQYSNALKDANRALKLDENEEFVDHSTFRKAKALIGLERHTNAESALNSIKKWYRLRHNHERALSQLLLVEKELLLLRLKVLVSQDYTLPLARLYALKFGSIKSALAAIETNCQTLIGSGDIDLSQHLKLIDESQKESLGMAANEENDMEAEDQEHCSTVYNSNCLIKALGSDVDSGQDSTNGWSDHTKPDKNGDDVFDEDDDDEIYFSDDDEYDMFYSHPDKWSNPKEILKLKHNYPFIPPEALSDPINSKGQRALWIGNVWPKCSIDLVTNLFMKFGNVTFCKIFYFPNETMNDVAYLLLHYDNGVSPRLVMAFFKDKIIPGISKDNLPLVIRFRNKSDKLSEDESMSVAAGGSSGANSSVGQKESLSGLSVGLNFSATHHQSSAASPGVSNLNSPTSSGGGGGGTQQGFGSISGSSLSAANSPASSSNKTIAAECYYWRTTGCDRERCQFRHIPPSKGIDRQSWMRRKN